MHWGYRRDCTTFDWCRAISGESIPCHICSCICYGWILSPMRWLRLYILWLSCACQGHSRVIIRHHQILSVPSMMVKQLGVSCRSQVLQRLLFERSFLLALVRRGVLLIKRLYGSFTQMQSIDCLLHFVAHWLTPWFSTGLILASCCAGSSLTISSTLRCCGRGSGTALLTKRSTTFQTHVSIANCGRALWSLGTMLA